MTPRSRRTRRRSTASSASLARSGSPAWDSMAQLWGSESIWHSGLAAEPSRPTIEERDVLVEHTGVAERVHVAAGRIRQPQVIIGDVGAHAAAERRVPPVLDVALRELAARRAQQLIAQHRRLGVDQRHRILE